MAKKDIIRAAKRAGFIVTDAWYGWTPTPGEMVPGWEIKLHPTDNEEDVETLDFSNTAEAVEYFRSLPDQQQGETADGR